MYNINFQSTIKPVRIKDYESIIAKIPSKHSINYPWRLADSVYANDCYTKRICDCSGCLITNGKDALMMHLRPDLEKNHNIKDIIALISEKFNIFDKNLQAILVGSKNTKKSSDLYNNLKSIFNNFKIPLTEIKNSKKTTHIAYKTDVDEFYITNLLIDRDLQKGSGNTDALIDNFEKVIISSRDSIKKC